MSMNKFTTADGEREEDERRKKNTKIESYLSKNGHFAENVVDSDGENVNRQRSNRETNKNMTHVLCLH